MKSPPTNRLAPFPWRQRVVGIYNSRVYDESLESFLTEDASYRTLIQTTFIIASSSAHMLEPNKRGFYQKGTIACRDSQARSAILPEKAGRPWFTSVFHSSNNRTTPSHRCQGQLSIRCAKLLLGPPRACSKAVESYQRKSRKPSLQNCRRRHNSYHQGRHDRLPCSEHSLSMG